MHPASLSLLAYHTIIYAPLIVIVINLWFLDNNQQLYYAYTFTCNCTVDMAIKKLLSILWGTLMLIQTVLTALVWLHSTELAGEHHQYSVAVVSLYKVNTIKFNVVISLCLQCTCTSLHSGGYKDIAESLLKGSNIDPNCSETNGWTPLHWAAEYVVNTAVYTVEASEWCTWYIYLYSGGGFWVSWRPWLRSTMLTQTAETAKDWLHSTGPAGQCSVCITSVRLPS